VLTLILADSELELVPSKLCGHPAVASSARKRNRSAAGLLLDSNLHYSALRNFPDGYRRGRPDLVHHFLLVALDSILNLEGGLRVVVHTRNGEVIRLKPDIRLPKNYTRFVALMEQLFAEGRVPTAGEPLMTRARGTVAELVKESGAGRVIVFSPAGRPAELRGFLASEPEKDTVCIIGGFPDGDYTSPVTGLATDVLSISPHLLKVWTVASEVLVNYPRPAGGKTTKAVNARPASPPAPSKRPNKRAKRDEEE
jgi:rRNA small subunit pseudouridine methyltransferase Nep1